MGLQRNSQGEWLVNPPGTKCVEQSEQFLGYTMVLIKVLTAETGSVCVCVCVYTLTKVHHGSQ